MSAAASSSSSSSNAQTTTLPSYTQGHSKAVLQSHASRTAENTAAFLLPHIRQDASILDVGCGPGTVTASFAKYVPLGKVVGIDYSEEAVRSARELVAASSPSSPDKKQAPGDCSFQVGSVFELPFEDGSFDVVFCSQVLLHLPDAVRALKEMRRVCKARGGIVATREADWQTLVIHPHTDVLEQWKDACETIFRSNGAEPNAGRMLITWGIEAGFTADQITYSTSNMTYAGKTSAEWWGSVMAQRTAGEDWKAKAREIAKLTHEQVEQVAQAWSRWSKAPDSVYTIVCGEALFRR